MNALLFRPFATHLKQVSAEVSAACDRNDATLCQHRSALWMYRGKWDMEVTAFFSTNFLS